MYVYAKAAFHFKLLYLYYNVYIVYIYSLHLYYSMYNLFFNIKL